MFLTKPIRKKIIKRLDYALKIKDIDKEMIPHIKKINNISENIITEYCCSGHEERGELFGYISVRSTKETMFKIMDLFYKKKQDIIYRFDSGFYIEKSNSYRNNFLYGMRKGEKKASICFYFDSKKIKPAMNFIIKLLKECCNE